MVPIRLVHFDRFAYMTQGLISEGSAPSNILVNGIAIVTGWLTGGPWQECYDAVTTSWSDCYSAPSTIWVSI